MFPERVQGRVNWPFQEVPGRGELHPPSPALNPQQGWGPQCHSPFAVLARSSRVWETSVSGKPGHLLTTLSNTLL